ncbi:MAG: T9SS type A sorting domain-containing protein [Bacteroidia bacterium]
MKKLITISTLALIMVSNLTNAQNYIYKFGVQFSDEGFDVKALPNGECIVVGQNSGGAGSSKQCMLVMRLNANGTIKWSKNLCNTDMTRATQVAVLSDGSFIVSGYTKKDMDDMTRVGAMVKFNANGDTVWFRGYNITPVSIANEIEFTSMHKVDDNEFIVGGTKFLASINGSGNVNWCYQLDYINPTIYHVTKTSDGGIAICGAVNDTTGGISVNNNMFLAKANSIGAIQWFKSYGISTHFETATGLVELPTGGFLMVGTTQMSGYPGLGLSDVIIVKTNANGDTVWTKLVGGEGTDAGAKIIKNGSNYIISGYSTTGITGGSDIMLLTINEDGDIISSKLSGPINTIQGRGIDISSENIFVTGAILGTDADMYVSKFSLDGTPACYNENVTFTSMGTNFVVRDFPPIQTTNKTLVSRGESLIRVGSMGFGNNLCDGVTGMNKYQIDNTFNIYPNPNKGKFTISGNMKGNFVLLDVNGNKLMDISVNDEPKTIELNLSSGIYILMNNETGIVKKILVD